MIRSDITPLLALWAAIIIVNVLTRRREKKPAAPARTGWLGYWLLAVLGGTYLAGFTALALDTRAYALVPVFGLLGLALVLPWPLSRHAFVRLGWARTACRLTRLAHWTWHAQRREGGVVAGCLALRAGGALRPVDAARLDWLETRLAIGPTSGVTPLALALIADLRGRRDEARRLLALCGWFDPRIVPPIARRMAREWLAADAAARGAWEEVAKHGGRFLTGAARRLLGAPAPSERRLRLLWLLSARRRHTRPLLERALAAAPAAADPAAAPAAADPLARAVALTVALRRAPDARLLLAAGDAWTAALSDASVEDGLRARAQALGAVDAARAPRGLREAAVAMLAAAAEDVDLRAADGEPAAVLASALQCAAEARLAALELLARAPADRAARDAPLAAVDELREWAALLAEYDRAARLGRHVEQLAFEQVHAAICNLAVSLFNGWGEKRLANAMFRWLQDRARALGLAHLDALYTGNVACGL